MTDTRASTESAIHSAAGNQSHPAYLSRAPVSQLLIACLFWGLCLTLSAAGHRLYKATVSLDRAVSADTYRTSGVPIAWVGHGAVEDSYQRIVGDIPTDGTAEVRALPNSKFWLAVALVYSALGGVMAWSGRWIRNSGIQSLVGLFAGHLLWLGAIELGLDAAGRRLGLAGALDVIDDRVVGTHAAGTFIQLSVVFLVPILIGLTMHESNRCAVFQWFRRWLPNVLGPSPSGRVENYAARTAIQFFMTVWFCYVGVLWLADPLAGRIGGIVLLLVFLAIIVATPYMIWRTARQPSAARAFRYSVSGAVVTWTAIEIAASMQLFREPWLSTSFSSGALLLGSSIVLTGLAARFLFTSRPIVMVSLSQATAVVSVLTICIAGCMGTSEPPPLTANEIEQRLSDYDERIGPPPMEAADGLLHALGSSDPAMRAQAAISLGKSDALSSVARERLETMASNDDSRLAQLAALQALDRLDLPTPELEEAIRQ